MRTCPARVTSEGNEVLQQTNGHNHPVDGVEAQAMKAGQRGGYPHSNDSYLTTIRHCTLKYIHKIKMAYISDDKQ